MPTAAPKVLELVRPSDWTRAVVASKALDKVARLQHEGDHGRVREVVVEVVGAIAAAANWHDGWGHLALHQLVPVQRHLEEWVLHSLRGSETARGVDAQQALEQRQRVTRKIGRVPDASLLDYPEKALHVVALERGRAGEELEDEAAKGPHVRLHAMTGLLDHLGRQVLGEPQKE